MSDWRIELPRGGDGGVRLVIDHQSFMIENNYIDLDEDGEPSFAEHSQWMAVQLAKAMLRLTGGKEQPYQKINSLEGMYLGSRPVKD